MRNLPHVYQSHISKNIRNNKEMCYVEEKEESERTDVVSTLKKIRTGLGIYNTKVVIKTKDMELDTKIISKGKREIITEDNRLIPIKDIIELQIKK